MKVGSLEIEILANLAKLRSDMEKANAVIGDTSKRINRALASIGNSLRIGLSAVAFGAFMHGAIGAADAMTNLESRLRLVTTSASQLRTVQDGLFQIAQQSRTSFTGLGDTYSQIARAANELGVSQNRMLGVTRTISQAIIISGVSAQAANAALIQLSQGMASGVLRGEELNSVMEQTPRLAMAIAQGMGIGIGQLRKMGQDGLLTANAVIAALEKSADGVAREFGAVTVTVGGATTMVSNSTTRLIGDMDDATGASGALSNGLQGVASALDAVGEAIREHQTMFAVVTGGLLGATTLAALPLLVTGLKLLGGAVVALGAVLAANPVVLALLGIGVIAGGIYAGAKQQSESVQGLTYELDALNRRIRETQALQANGVNISAASPERLAALLEARAAVQARFAAATAGTIDNRAEDARFARREQEKTARIQAEAKATVFLTEVRGNLAGVDKDYMATLSRLNELRSEGLVDEKLYVEIVSELAKKTWQKGDAFKSAQKAAKDLSAEQERQKRLILELNGLAPSFVEEWNRLSAAHHSGAITLAQLTTQQAVLLAQQPIIRKNLEDEQRLRLAILAQQQETADERLADEVQDSQTRARFSLSISQAAEALADEQTLLEAERNAIGLSEQARTAALETLRIELKLRRDLWDLEHNLAFSPEQRATELDRLRANAEQAKAQVKQRAALEEQIDMIGSIERTAHDVWVNVFEGGSNAFKKLGQTLKASVLDLLYQMTIKKWVISIAANVLGGGSSGGGGLLGSIGSMFGSSGGGGTLSTVGNSVGNMFGFPSAGDFMSSIGSSLGLSGAVGTGSMFTGTAGTVLSKAALDGTMAFGANSIAGASALPASGAMGALGAAMPWIGGALAIGSLLSKKRGGPKTEGWAGHGVGIDGAPNTTGAQMAEIVAKFEAQANAALTTFGGTGNARFGLMTSADPKGTAPTFVVSRGTSNGIELAGNDNTNVGRDEASMQAEIDRQMKDMLVKALRAADLPGELGNLLRQDMSVNADRISKIVTERAALDARMFDLTATALEKLNKQREDELATIDAVNRNRLLQVHAQEDLISASGVLVEAFNREAPALRAYAEAIRDFLRTLAVGPLSPNNMFGRAAAARREYEATLTSARANDEGARGRLVDAARTHLEQMRATSGTRAEFSLEVAKVAADLALEASNADSAATVQQQQLEQLKLLNVNVLTFGEAMARFTAAQAAVDAINEKANAANTSYVGAPPAAPVDPWAEFAGGPDAAAALQYRQLGYSVEQARQLLKLYGANGSVPQFIGGDMGGSFAVGTNFVPFDMTAKVHKGERIVPARDNPYSNPYTSDGGNEMTEAIADLTQELAGLRAENRAIVRQGADMRRSLREMELRGVFVRNAPDETLTVTTA